MHSSLNRLNRSSRRPRRCGAGVALLVLAFVAGRATGLRAQRPSARGITLADALALAQRDNADVRVASAVVDSARAERRIAAALPNPTLSGSPNSPYQYLASIPLDITPQRTYRVRVADRGAAAAEADRLDVARQVTVNVARAFYDALLAEEKRRLSTSRRDAVSQVLASDSARFRAGDIPERTLVRSEVELARADAEVARATLDVYATRLALQGVIGVAHPDTAVAATGDLAYDRLDPSTDSLVAEAKLRRPDLVASRARVEQSASAERAAASLLFPTPQLVYARQTSAPFDNGRYYQLGFSLELPVFNAYGPQRQRAAAGRAAADASSRRTEAQIERDVTAAAAEFRANRALVERYEGGLVAKMAESVKAAQYAYARGATSLLEMLDAVRADEDVRTELATALHDYWVSVYALNAAVGTQVLRPTR